MSTFRKKRSTVYTAVQSGIGDVPSITGANAVRVTRDTTFIQPTGDVVERGLLGPDTEEWPAEDYVVNSYGEGSLTRELNGSGTAGTPPEYGAWLKSLLGTEYVSAADTVLAGTGLVGGFDSTEQYQVGSMCRVKIGTGYEIRRITSVTDNGDSTYTNAVHRDFSGAPADGAEICAGVTYLRVAGVTETYLRMLQYLDGMEIDCKDTACETLSTTVAEKDIIRGTFGFSSQTVVTDDATDSLTPSYDGQPPLVGKSCNMLVGGTATNMPSFEFSIKTRKRRGGINSDGISEQPWMNEFEAEAKITPWVENKSPFTAFFNATKVSIEQTNGTVAGNIRHIELAGLQRTKPSIGEDDGDFSWDDPMKITQGVYIAYF